MKITIKETFEGEEKIIELDRPIYVQIGDLYRIDLDEDANGNEVLHVSSNHMSRDKYSETIHVIPLASNCIHVGRLKREGK
jgi:hypothetical protein